MKVLIVDATSLDKSMRQRLYLRGYRVQWVSTATEALSRIVETSFDCVVVGIPRSAGYPLPALSEIQQLVRSSAVALMTSESAESLMEQALQDGSVGLQSAGHWIPMRGPLHDPLLLVARELDPRGIWAMRQDGHEAVYARTLTFLLKLLVDGSGQVILIEANVPGLSDDCVLTVRRVTPHLLAVLASAMSAGPSGVVHALRPQTLGELIDLFERTADNGLSHCGLAQAGRIGRPLPC